MIFVGPSRYAHDKLLLICSYDDCLLDLLSYRASVHHRSYKARETIPCCPIDPSRIFETMGLFGGTLAAVFGLGGAVVLGKLGSTFAIWWHV